MSIADLWLAVVYAIGVPMLLAPLMLWVAEPILDWYDKREERMRRLDGKK